MANKQTVFENNNKTKPVDDIWLNMVNEEYRKLCIGTGQTPDADTSQLVKGAVILASQAYLFCVDSGTTNNYVLNPVSPLQAPPSLRNGLSIKFTTANANSGSTNINAYGFGNILAKNQDGTNLVAGDIPANTMVQFYYNGTNWILDKGAKATTTTQGISYLNNPITIANNATDANNDIDFSAGNFQFSDGSGQAVATAIMTKRLDETWSAGTNQGGLLNGTAVPKANDSTYHCYAIYNPTNNVIDFAFLLGVSGTAPDPTSVLPSGYTKFAFRGSVITDGSGNIIPFNQFGRTFAIAPRIQFTNTSQSFNTETLRTLQVPKGINVKASGNITLRATGTGSANAMIYDADTSITITTHLTNLWAAANTTEGSCSYQCWTNKSGQLKTNAVINAGSPTCTLSIALTGWEFDNKTLNF